MLNSQKLIWAHQEVRPPKGDNGSVGACPRRSFSNGRFQHLQFLFQRLISGLTPLLLNHNILRFTHYALRFQLSTHFGANAPPTHNSQFIFGADAPPTLQRTTLNPQPIFGANAPPTYL